MKKWLIGMLVCTCLIGSGSSFAVATAEAQAAAAITVTVNDRLIDFDTKPMIDHGIVFVPLRFIVNELGGQIAGSSNNEVIITKGTKTISMKVGSKKITIDDKELELQAAPKLINGRTLVPLRVLSEVFGATVHYENHQVHIHTVTEETTRGNSIGNLNNGGWYVSDQEWIYYNNQNDSGRLYKEKYDNSENQLVSDDKYIGALNLVGKQLYYTSDNKLFKCDIDGANRTLVHDFGLGANLVSIVGDWIYYTQGTYMYKPLYRMKLDGTARELLVNYQVSSIAVTNGKIYYTIEAQKLFVMDTDGRNKKKLLTGNYITWVEVKGQSLYFNYKGKLYTMHTDGTALTQISDLDARNINIQGDRLYFSNYSEYSKKLYRLNLLDHTTQKLSEDKVYYVHILNKKLFFYNPDIRVVEEIEIEGA
ncbi:DUF5050 domain-containing protein [Paenibacillus sp. CF384]|uniref:DUF5050 domain-containing protein n=1 Tax=Paenibacillus sp. CF384 TaxID=1884382 RepID=UPI00089AB711|nr:DUF5050 domain-containing protein [Paenibacillus sp. CF384]SDX38301.1 Copper amine oxidase N-terminal domain-containing protein [Paenibacillus sp. CF384]